MGPLKKQGFLFIFAFLQHFLGITINTQKRKPHNTPTTQSDKKAIFQTGLTRVLA